MSRNADGAGGTNPDAAQTTQIVTYDGAQDSHRHRTGADLDAHGWSTCPACGTLWNPSVTILDGARARRRLRRAS